MIESVTIEGARISTEVLSKCLNAMAENKPILLIGPAGAGKTLLARRLASLRGGPFRCPHHTVSQAGMVGSLRYPTGGELARANQGTLYLDEMPEFQRSTLDGIRLAHRDKQISHYDREAETHIGVVTDFYLIAGLVPCPCGNKGGTRACKCPADSVDRYRSRTGTFEAAVDFAKVRIKLERDEGPRPVIVSAPNIF